MAEMSHVIIGIHGLGNKPPIKMLRKWWIRSIREGFLAYNYPAYFFKFELCFWADIVHPTLLNPKSDNKKDSLAEDEPYVRATKYETKQPNPVKRKMLDLLEKKMDKAFVASKMSQKLEILSEVFIHNFFSDLDVYFSDRKKGSESVNSLIQNRLIELLNRHKDDKILLISHSMGTIIAYDVLSHVLRDFPIDTFITAGSPLGLPFIMQKLAPEQKSNDQLPLLKTPASIQRSWYNLSDLDDKVAANYNLADDYTKNSNGIGVTDLIVSNNYEYKGQKNHHKIFGYLRTPEMANILYEFVNQGRPAWRRGFESAVYHGMKMIKGGYR
jgi:hypothetical protein